MSRILFFIVQNTSPLPKHFIISTCGGPQPAGNVAAGEHYSCQCPFMVFRAWQTRVSLHCSRRKCRENSLPGWSDSLIHSALLDLRLTVQLLPINVKTRRGQKKKKTKKKKEKRRKRGEREEKEEEDDVKFESSLLLHCEVGHQEVAQLAEQASSTLLIFRGFAKQLKTRHIVQNLLTCFYELVFNPN